MRAKAQHRHTPKGACFLCLKGKEEVRLSSHILCNIEPPHVLWGAVCTSLNGRLRLCVLRSEPAEETLQTIIL